MKQSKVALITGASSSIAGVTFSQRVMMAAIPITPKKMLLKQIRQMQVLKA